MSLQVFTDDNFDAEVLKSSQPVLVDFWAPWCGPCVSITPALETIASEWQGQVTIGKLNVDENANTPATYGVRSIPYFVLIREGEVIDTVVGASKEKLTAMLEKNLSR